MTEIKPRFEFRTFGQGFGPIVERMRRVARMEAARESHEIYIMSAANNENNTKIRDDKMDIKVFVQEIDGLEQWNPRMKGTFPMSVEMIRDEVFPAFGVAVPAFKREVYTLDEFIEEIIRPHQDLVAVDVFKRRFAFTINGVIAEWAKVLINGAAIETICLESVDREAIIEGLSMIGAEQMENVNYLMAIKRVIGMEPLPDDFIPVML
ncbi:hypothetical protein KKF91_21960 [Myxococcota bacterium]|nr:hypothetical protein [Myxococcota bacterium]MBU1433212.1 hypothetical protein [Myxococcota bacterium]MBU1896330.1 hypothetical protein [Myxococcota bacterium]